MIDVAELTCWDCVYHGKCAVCELDDPTITCGDFESREGGDDDDG